MNYNSEPEKIITVGLSLYDVEVDTKLNNMNMIKLKVVLISSLILHLSASSIAMAEQEFSNNSAVIQKIASASENSWVRLNKNKFKDVWTPDEQLAVPEDEINFITGSPLTVIAAWSSMAWDSNRGSLIFWGGGHANYTGNEVYLWDANSLLWKRGSLPSAIKQVNPEVNPSWFEAVGGVFDAPISSHTYDNSEFLPIADRFITFGGASYALGTPFVRSVNINRNTGPYLWDPSRADAGKTGGSTGTQANASRFPDVIGGNMWENRNNIPQRNFDFAMQFLEETTAYTQENGKDVILFTLEQQLMKYTLHDVADSSNDTYHIVGKADSFTYSGQGAGAYDPLRKVYVRTAGSDFVYWNLKNASPVLMKARINNPDNLDFSRLKFFGMDFDPQRNRFLLWSGDREVWSLTLPDNLNDAWELSLIPGRSTLPVFPDISRLQSDSGDFTFQFTGILGKWKYIRSLDVFLGVGDPLSGDIWAYKPENWNHDAVFVDPPPVAGNLPDGSCGSLDCASKTGVLPVSHQISSEKFSVPFTEVPVVIAGIPTLRGFQPGVVSVNQITNTGFQIRFLEWDYLDGFHLQESVGYLALLPGTYFLDDGTVIEVGTFQTSGTGQWQRVDFSAEFQNNPRVFLTLQTRNGYQAVTPRIRNVTTDTFEVGLFEQESEMLSGHVTETVGYIAISEASDSGVLTVSGQLQDFFVTTTHLAVKPRSVFGRDIVLQEEQSADDEVQHLASEAVYVMQVGELLFGQIASDAGFDTISLRIQ